MFNTEAWKGGVMVDGPVSSLETKAVQRLGSKHWCWTMKLRRSQDSIGEQPDIQENLSLVLGQQFWLADLGP